MSMRLSILVSFFSLISMTCHSQNLPVNFNDCKTDLFFTVVDQKPSFNNDSLTISDYFNQYFIETKSIKNFSGKVFLGILIFEDGKPCCKSFINMSQEDIKPELFREAVNNMPLWTPAKQTNKAVPFLMQLPLNFKNGQVISP